MPNRKENFAAFPLQRLQTEHLEVLRDRKEHVPSAQVNGVKVPKALFKWATPKKVPINLARDLTVETAPAPAGITAGHRRRCANSRNAIRSAARRAWRWR